MLVWQHWIRRDTFRAMGWIAGASATRRTVTCTIVIPRSMAAGPSVAVRTTQSRRLCRVRALTRPALQPGRGRVYARNGPATGTNSARRPVSAARTWTWKLGTFELFGIEVINLSQNASGDCRKPMKSAAATTGSGGAMTNKPTNFALKSKVKTKRPSLKAKVLFPSVSFSQ